MARNRRHTLGFDSLEAKGDYHFQQEWPTLQPPFINQKATHFHLNGKLNGIPSGIAVPNGFIVSSFLLNGNVASMGTVEGAFFLKYRFIQFGKLPDLSKSRRWCLSSIKKRQRSTFR